MAAGKAVRNYRTPSNPEAKAAINPLPSTATNTASPSESGPIDVPTVGISTPDVPTLAEIQAGATELRHDLDALLGGDNPHEYAIDDIRAELQEWELRKQALGAQIEQVARQRCETDPEAAAAALNDFVDKLDGLGVQGEISAIRRLEMVEKLSPEAVSEATQDLLVKVNGFLESYGLETVPPGDHTLTQTAHHVSQQVREMERRVDEAHAGLAEARLSVLQEIRPMGGSLEMNDNSHNKGVVAAQAAAQFYPRDWIDASNREGNLRVKFTKGRAHYTALKPQKQRKPEVVEIWHQEDQPPTPHPSQDVELVPDATRSSMFDRDMKLWRISYFDVRYPYDEHTPVPRGWKEHTYVTAAGDEMRCFRKPRTRMVTSEKVAELTVDYSGTSCAVHELAHRMEHVGPSRIWVTQDAFLYRRAAGQAKRALFSHRPSEVGYSDDFNSPYQGKVYGHLNYVMADGKRKNVSHHETLSTGMEAMFGGEMYSYGGLIGGRPGKKADPDMAAHILGTLAIA